METEADNLEQYLRYLEGGEQYAVESQPMEDEVCMSNTLGIVEPGENFENYLKYLEGDEKYAIELPQRAISRKVVRRNYTSVATQTEDSLDLFRLKCVQLEKSNKALAKKCAEYEVKLNEAKNHQIQIPFLSPETLADISKPPRYNLDAISTATCIYSAGPRCYRLLRKMNLPLPSPSTLRRWASKLCVEPGLQVQTLAHMKSYELPLEDKLCVLSFDEMKVREEWAYDRKNDKAIPPKKKVQVAMVRGLRGSWKQPIFYDFDFAMKEETILYIISELYKIGYTVVAAVSDLGTENQALWTNMGISVEKPFFAHPCDEQKMVFVFADVPHVIKLFRNHFADHGFLYENILLKKDVIEELISICNADLNIIKTLTLEMLNVKGPGRNENILCSEANVQQTEDNLMNFETLGDRVLTLEEDKDEAHALEDETLTHHVFKEINDVPLSPEESTKDLKRSTCIKA